MSYSTAWEIPPDKVHRLGCTLGDGVNMVIPGKFTTDVQAEIFGILCRVYVQVTGLVFLVRVIT